MSSDLTVERVLSAIRGMKVLVIGDMMLDISIWYKTLRRASEFDGNILVEDHRINYPGGAANVAMNCNALGANVTLLGAYGTDRAGLNLISILQSNLIKVPTTVWEGRKKWRTATKTRVFVDEVPLHRIDNDFFQDLGIVSVIGEIEDNDYDLILLSDYQKGVFSGYYTSKWIIDRIIKKSPGIVIAANPKPSLTKLLPHIDLLSMNRSEMHEAGEDTVSWSDCADCVVRTLGPDGLDLSYYGSTPKRYNTVSVESPDVVGCGDTVFSAMSLVMANSRGFTLDILGKIGVAAGTAKALKKGTHPVTAKDIIDMVRRIEDGNKSG